jgi:hypothetical protein
MFVHAMRKSILSFGLLQFCPSPALSLVVIDLASSAFLHGLEDSSSRYKSRAGFPHLNHPGLSSSFSFPTVYLSFLVGLLAPLRNKRSGLKETHFFAAFFSSHGRGDESLGGSCYFGSPGRSRSGSPA